MAPDDLPPTGTCDLITTGRRSGLRRSTEIWYLVVDDEIVITGTPGPRAWLSNLRQQPVGLLRLRNPCRDLAFIAEEVTDPAARRHLAERARDLQPWYGEQPYSVEDWVDDAPMVVLRPQ